MAKQAVFMRNFAVIMSITSIIRPFFRSRYRAIERYGTHAEEIQRKVLAHLLQRAADTEWGLSLIHI